MTKQGNRGCVCVEAILGEKLKGAAKRVRLEKKQKSLKKKKVKETKVLAEAVSALFDAQNIRYCNRLYQYLLATRVYDVGQHVEVHRNDEKLQFPERDIDNYGEE